MEKQELWVTTKHFGKFSQVGSTKRAEIVKKKEKYQNN